MPASRLIPPLPSLYPYLYLLCSFDLLVMNFFGETEQDRQALIGPTSVFVVRSFSVFVTGYSYFLHFFYFFFAFQVKTESYHCLAWSISQIIIVLVPYVPRSGF